MRYQDQFGHRDSPGNYDLPTTIVAALVIPVSIILGLLAFIFGH